MLALIVFGMQNQLEPIGPVDYNCPNCGYTPTTLCWAQRKATIYWIPLFGMGGKSYALACDNCGFQSQIDDQLGQQLEQTVGSVPNNPPAAQPIQQSPAVVPARSDYVQPALAAQPERPTTVLNQPPAGVGQQTTYLGPIPEAAAGDLQTRSIGSADPSAQATHCATCGALVPPGARFCQNCGAQVAQAASGPLLTCPNCGRQQNGGRFCNNCGAVLTGGAAG